MAIATRPVAEGRIEQMFPSLDPHEVQRLRRFGEVRTYPPGAYLARAGEVSPGMFLILAGDVDVTQRDGFGRSTPIVTHSAGYFMAGIGALSGTSWLCVLAVCATRVQHTCVSSTASFRLRLSIPTPRSDTVVTSNCCCRRVRTFTRHAPGTKMRKGNISYYVS